MCVDKQSIDDRIKSRICRVLGKTVAPMKIRDLQARSGSRSWGATEFRAALLSLIEDRIVWHENGEVKLLDWTKAQTTASPYHFPNTSDLPPVGSTLTEEW